MFLFASVSVVMNDKHDAFFFFSISSSIQFSLSEANTLRSQTGSLLRYVLSASESDAKDVCRLVRVCNDERENDSFIPLVT